MLCMRRVLKHTFAYLSTHTVYQYKIIFMGGGGGGGGAYWKTDTGKHNFMRFCCFKLSTKIEKLLNE